MSPSESGIAENMEQRIKNEGKKKKEKEVVIHYFCFVVVTRISAAYHSGFLGQFLESGHLNCIQIHKRLGNVQCSEYKVRHCAVFRD